jgi:cbb3-type cytochrome c oxidase subunit III
MYPDASPICRVSRLLLQAGLWSCQLGLLLAGEIPSIDSSSLPSAQVRSITLPHLEPELAVAPGRDEFMMVCLSCHSPRYVLMQPPFARSQWEQTVDKMAKNYGAQMDREQRDAIIGYLVATHGPNAVVQQPTSDDDFSAISVTQVPFIETVPVLQLPAGGEQFSGAVQRGASLFTENCAGCHGSKGRGDGFVASLLWRKPKDLSSTRFSLAFLSQVLWNGKRGTAMPSWRGLASSDRAALAAYVQTLYQPEQGEPPSVAPMPDGAKLFLLNCAPCHGESGDGNGASAANLLPKPANFKLKQPNSGYLLEILNDGIPGTAMPSWKDQISESDRRALAEFVRSLFDSR